MASPLARVAIEQIELERGNTLAVFVNTDTPGDRRIELFSDAELH